MLAAVLSIAWMVVAGCATLGTIVYRRGVAKRLTTPPVSGVAVIVPVKGTIGITPFLAAITGQAGVDYRLIFALESPGDPAWPILAAHGARDGRISLVAAGPAVARGQKIQNQLAALASLLPADTIVVFADADTRPPADWLAMLVRPLALGLAELASGYRWILPDDDRLPSRLAALMDWTIATAPRSTTWNICWGGSIAVTRAALGRIDLPRTWSGAVLDDLVLTRAARAAGIRVFAPKRVLMPSPVRHDWASLMDFGRRQYLLVRLHAPRHWWLAGVTLALPVVACAAALLAGTWFGLISVAIAVVLQQFRLSQRLRIVAAALPASAQASMRLVRRDRWLLPVAHMLHLVIFLTSAVGRTMTWGGIRYRIAAWNRVTILNRAS